MSVANCCWFLPEYVSTASGLRCGQLDYNGFLQILTIQIQVWGHLVFSTKCFIFQQLLSLLMSPHLAVSAVSQPGPLYWYADIRHGRLITGAIGVLHLDYTGDVGHMGLPLGLQGP